MAGSRQYSELDGAPDDTIPAPPPESDALNDSGDPNDKETVPAPSTQIQALVGKQNRPKLPSARFESGEVRIPALRPLTALLRHVRNG